MKRYLTAFALTALLGTGLHYLYPLLPIPLVGIIAPVSESPWEHLKLIFWPFLAGSLLLYRGRFSFWGGVCISLLTMPPFLLGLYYTLLAGFSVSSPWVDIGLYYLTLALGFMLLAHTQGRNRSDRCTGILIALTAIWCSCLVVLSLLPPEVPVFRG